MSYIPISSFVTVSIANPPAGLAAPNPNNIALLTKEAPVNTDITQTNPGYYQSAIEVGADWGTSSEVYSQAQAIFNQSPNIISGGGLLIIFPMDSGDTLADAIAILQPIAAFGAVIWAGYTPNDAEVLAAASAVESTTIKLIASSYLQSSLATTTGLFWIINDNSYYQTFTFYYGVGGTALSARLAAAALAGRMFSVDFEGSNTTSDLHAKPLVGVSGDTTVSTTVLATCQNIGVNVYVSTGGAGQYVGACFMAARNSIFPDSIYNRNWFVNALQYAGFNAIRQASSKLPQTEQGMAVLRGAFQTICQQAVTNQFFAPGTWNGDIPFGDPQTFTRNIGSVGYYIYSLPVASQSQAQRQARQAPLIQIAGKEAGSIESASVVIYIQQ